MAPFFERHEVLLTPTLAKPPALIGALQPTAAETRAMRAVNAVHGGALFKALGVARQLAAKTFEYMPNTALFNATGQPAMSLPLHWNAAGLPIGMQFVARLGDEATLFRLAGQIELAQPWFERVPPGY